MIINRVDYFFDGGTAILYTDEGNYYIDRRLDTTTPIHVYKDHHPDEDISVHIEDRETIRDVYNAIVEFVSRNSEDTYVRSSCTSYDIVIKVLESHQ